MTGPKNGDWWKGSFPTWIVLLMVSMLGYFFNRELQENDRRRSDLEQMVTALRIDVGNLQTKMVWIEQAVHDNNQLLNSLYDRIQHKTSP